MDCGLTPFKELVQLQNNFTHSIADATLIRSVLYFELR
jgi:hypothetical protein